MNEEHEVLWTLNGLVEPIVRWLDKHAGAKLTDGPEHVAEFIVTHLASGKANTLHSQPANVIATTVIDEAHPGFIMVTLKKQDYSRALDGGDYYMQLRIPNDKIDTAVAMLRMYRQPCCPKCKREW